jgi:hypothetical protein
MDTVAQCTKTWLTGLWNFVSTTLPALLRVFARLAIVLFAVQSVAFLFACGYFFFSPYFGVSPLPANYLWTVVERLAEWGWATGLLGTLAIWISERMKWQEKLDGLRQELEEAHRYKHWEKMTRISERYSELRNKNPEARDKNIEKRLACGMYIQAIKVEKTEEWDGVLGQLQTILALVRDHNEAKQLERLLKKEPQEFDGEDLECLEKLPPLQACSLIMYLLGHKNRRTIPKDSALKEWLLKIVQKESGEPSKTDENKSYLLSILGAPPSQATPEIPLDYWLEQHGFDFSKACRVLTGRVEDEPETDSPILYAAGWSGAMVEPTQSIEMIAKPEHSIMIGNDGHGKTMLYRMLQRKSDPALKRAFVRWTKCVELLEEHQVFAVSQIIFSLIQEVRSTLVQDERWKVQVQAAGLSSKSDSSASSWRNELAALKKVLGAGGIDAVFIGLDGLEHYPETWRNSERLNMPITAILRPEVLQDHQPWFVKLFVSPRLYEQMHDALQHSIAFHAVPIKWDREGLRAVLQERLRYLRKESQSRAEPALQEIADPQIENLLLEKARSPRDVVRLLHALMSHRAAKWDQSGRKEEDLDITLADWLEVQGN